MTRTHGSNAALAHRVLLGAARMISLAAVGTVAMAIGAAAQTSSWSTRTHDSGAPKEGGRDGDWKARAAQPRVVRPQSAPTRRAAPYTTRLDPKGATKLRQSGKPAPAAKTGAPSTGAASARGEDPAYYAFDRGEFLTALKLAKEAAAKGEPEAHTLIGRIYAEGHGVARNLAEAARWYHRAAELDDPEGAFALGLMYAEGRGVDKNFDYAARLFERAAMKRHIYANYNLGLLFLYGRGKPENPIRGAQHIAYAAEHGVPAAQYDLATLYLTGHGVPNDAYAASTWFKRAAALGMAQAQYEYAVMLLRGQGLNSDRPRALEYLTAAANKGQAGAQNRLAHAYLEGAGVEKSLREAAKWRLIAAAQGIADEKLDGMITKLPAADRRAAEQLASAWLDKAAVGGAPM